MFAVERPRGHATRRRGGLGRATASAAAAMLVLGGLALSASATTNPTLQSVNVPGYNAVLANKNSHTLYLLTTEKGAKLHCKAACAKTWPPLLVKLSVKSVTIGSGVKGKVGFVKRTASTKQVTFNSYPVYIYSGDGGAKMTNGEGIHADGGIWLMLSAASTTVPATPVKPLTTLLNAKSVTYYPGILANGSNRSLYLLSVESGGTLHCTAACLNTWVPLEVSTNTGTPMLGAGVDGTVGYVSRGPSLYQVTYNGYPVYRYAFDSSTTTVNGEGVAADGGTWYLLKASATTAGATPVLPFGGY